MSKLLRYSLLAFFVIIMGGSIAQPTLIYTNEDYNIRIAKELFDKQLYAEAQHFFTLVIDQYGSEHTDVKAEAEYYAALCSIELFNNDAEYRITNFITKYPESVQTRYAYFEMGKFQYRKNKFDVALFYFNKVWKQHLSKEQLSEYYFKRGYSYFKTDDFEKANKMFFEIIDKESKYRSPALYYYSHIAYEEGNYETAMNGFVQLEQDATFAAIVPYYLVQIYYLQGKTDKVLKVGPELLSQSDSKRQAEISRLVGEALYKNGQYNEALPYLEKYKQNAETYTREDIYQLGYVLYMNQQYNEAITTLNNIINANDALSQNALFHIAHCYLKLEKKEQAMRAFEAASRSNFDGDIQEVALLNYAKLSYELSYSPFNETITAFYTYLASYPNSIHQDEAYSYLAKVYLTSKNYREALASINKIKVKTPEMLGAYQRVSFFRGLELFNNLQFDEALAAFEISESQKAYDKRLHALAFYWKAEAQFRLKQYETSAETYNRFLLIPGAYSLAEYNLTYYNLGYCYFKLKNYPQAITWYRKYIDKGIEVDVYKRADALIRVADSYFMTRDYEMAVTNYKQAIKLDTIDQDYALFQEGFSYGLLKKHGNKIASLTGLLSNYPASAYYADALFERGRSFVAIDSADSAVKDFNTLIARYPNSSYRVRSLLQLGLIHYSEEHYNEALASFKTVVTDYNGTPEAKDAMLGIKNIYVDMNKVDDYFAYAKANGAAIDVSVSEKDSLTYIAAEKIYMASNFNLSQNLFTGYIKNYPDGRFIINARYYRADCYLRNEMADSALYDFAFVVEKPNNIFTESAMLNTAQLLDAKGKYKEAFDVYKKLENQAEIKSNLIIARLGQMNMAFSDSVYTEAIEASRKVLMTEKVAEEDVRKARLIMGKSYLAQKLSDAAITQFRILALDATNLEGAESNFLVAKILYSTGNQIKAEEAINHFIEAGTPHQYWLGKAFILLSQIFINQNDNFQAKVNLQSVIDNYGNKTDGIIVEAQVMLARIVGTENSQFQPVETIQPISPQNSVTPDETPNQN